MDISGLSIPALIVVGIIAFFAINGYRKGFLKLAVSLASMVLTFYLVGVISPYISTFLMENTTIYEKVYENVGAAVDNFNMDGAKSEEEQSAVINSLELPTAVAGMVVLNNTADKYKDMMVSGFKEYVTDYLTRMTIHVISFVSAYVIIMLLMKLTVLSMSFITKIPIISGLNRMAGLAFGSIQGICVVWFLMVIAMIFASDTLMGMVAESHILSYLYKNNILLLIMINFL